MTLYDAFISYSHAKDKPIAAALQSVVQKLGKPWYRRRALRVFRDDTSLSATPSLWPTIEQALGQSRFLDHARLAGGGRLAIGEQGSRHIGSTTRALSLRSRPTCRDDGSVSSEFRFGFLNAVENSFKLRAIFRRRTVMKQKKRIPANRGSDHHWYYPHSVRLSVGSQSATHRLAPLTQFLLVRIGSAVDKIPSRWTPRQTQSLNRTVKFLDFGPRAIREINGPIAAPRE
jgi:hypothetical protein